MAETRVTGSITYTWDTVIELDNIDDFSLNDLFERNGIPNAHAFSRYLWSDAQRADEIYINDSPSSEIIVSLTGVENGAGA